MSDVEHYGERVAGRERIRLNLALSQAGLIRAGVENAMPRDEDGKQWLLAIGHEIDVLEELLR